MRSSRIPGQAPLSDAFREAIRATSCDTTSGSYHPLSAAGGAAPALSRPRSRWLWTGSGLSSARGAEPGAISNARHGSPPGAQTERRAGPAPRQYHGALALVSGPPAGATSAATRLEHEGRSDGEHTSLCRITSAARAAAMTAAPTGSGQGGPTRGRTVVVFGGTGFLGRRVALHLLGHGFQRGRTAGGAALHRPDQAPEHERKRDAFALNLAPLLRELRRAGARSRCCTCGSTVRRR